MRSIFVTLAACAMAVAGCRTPRAATESVAAPTATTATSLPAIAPPATPLPGDPPSPARDLPPVVRPAAAIVPLEAHEAAGAVASHAEPLPAESLQARPRPSDAIARTESAATPVAEPLRLDLIQSLETALLQNPDLTALRRNEGVSVAAVGVARTYPFNPFLQIQATPYQHAKYESPGTVYHYVLLMQQIQLGGQQRFREENALAALNSVRWNLVQAELLNVAQTERLYFTALYLRGIRDLTEAGAGLNDQLLRILEKRLEAGDAAAADVAIVRLDNRAARQQARLAESNYRTALLELKRHLNLPIAMAFEPAGDLSEWEWLSPLVPQPPQANGSEAANYALENATSVAASLTASRPDVLAARSDLAAARANAGLARGSRRPDLQIGPYYQRTESGRIASPLGGSWLKSSAVRRGSRSSRRSASPRGVARGAEGAGLPAWTRHAPQERCRRDRTPGSCRTRSRIETRDKGGGGTGRRAPAHRASRARSMPASRRKTPAAQARTPWPRDGPTRRQALPANKRPTGRPLGRCRSIRQNPEPQNPVRQYSERRYSVR